MSELFLEIEKDIKRDYFDKIWRKIGGLAVYVSVAIITATAGFVAWENYKQTQSEAKTSELLYGVERLNAEDYKAAISIFSALAEDDTSPYYLLAMLRKSQAQELNGDMDGAKKTYLILAKADSEFSQLAKIKAVEKGEVLEALASSPFYYTLEESNAWRLLSSGKKKEAVDIFVALVNDKKTPDSLSKRVAEVLRVIAPEKLTEKKVNNE